MHRTPRCLVLLTGPVGVGKSTVARAGAQRLRELSCPTAVIDLDLVYGMAQQSEGFGDELTWRIARGGAAALAGAFFQTGMAAVILEGGFQTPAELADATAGLPSEVRTRLVTLQGSFATVWQRVSWDPDPGRVASRNQPFLKTLHDEFSSSLSYLRSRGPVLEADHAGPDELASTIAKLTLEALALPEQPAESRFGPLAPRRTEP